MKFLTTGLIVVSLLALGCGGVVSPPGVWVSAEGDVGAPVGPSIREEYCVRGIVLSAGLAGSPVNGAHVAGFRADELLSETTASPNGKFYLRLAMDGKPVQAGIKPHTAVLEISENPEVVTHNFAGVQGHEHWVVRLVVEAPGFKTARIDVEVPRDLKAPRVKILMEPLPAAGTGQEP